ncbi:MAG: hypothetical protein GVY28_05615 [Alphaproteobacteria bacterium]|jgi:hypothetical protein|nr:hypothetical protein [Alphaproteobacteria bacterium]
MGWIAIAVGAGLLAYATRLTGTARSLVALPGLVALVFGLALLAGLVAA